MKAIVHIGAPKTGTTSIQAFLHRNAPALAERGFDPQMGARPMARVIQEHIKRQLADELLFGALEGGGKVTVSEADGELTVKAEPLAKALVPA